MITYDMVYWLARIRYFMYNRALYLEYLPHVISYRRANTILIMRGRVLWLSILGSILT